MGSKENQCSKKRKHTLLKKASELSTLCGTDALIIIQDSTDPTQSQIWPQNPDQVHRILNRYKHWNIAKAQRDPKRRKVDPTVHDHSAHDDRIGLLGLVDSKLSLVISRLRDLQNEDGLIGFHPTVEDPSHGVSSLSGFDDRMFGYDPTVEDRSHGVSSLSGFDDRMFGYDPTVEDRSHGVSSLSGFDDRMFGYDPTVKDRSDGVSLLQGFDDRMLGYDPTDKTLDHWLLSFSRNL